MRRSWRALQKADRGPFDPYRILGLSPSAGKEEIKRAYHRLALRYHPDGGPEGCKERFQAVNEAYEALKSGKWQPQGANNGSADRKGHGWDPRMGMYVYEQPGSTTENYVDGRTQTLLRLCVLWTAAFVIVRFFLLWVFPFTGDSSVVQLAFADNSGGSAAPALGVEKTAKKAGPSAPSFHGEQNAESAPTFVNSVLTDAGCDVDPLRRR